MENMEFDLVILDIMLPDISGLSICQMVRDKGCACPVIMLTAKDSETDKITGLTLGADDYITKPFRPLELIARVKAQLNSKKKHNTPFCSKFYIVYQIYCSHLFICDYKIINFFLRIQRLC